MAFPYEDQTENESAVVNKDANTNGCKDKKNNDAVKDLVTIYSDQSEGVLWKKDSPKETESCVITMDQNGEQTKNESIITRCWNEYYWNEYMLKEWKILIGLLVIFTVLSYIDGLLALNPRKTFFEK